MKRRDRWLVPYLARAVAVIIRLWMSMARLRVVSADGRAHPTDPASGRFLYAFWHEGLLAPLATRTKIRVLISQHTDGELIAQVCQQLGIGVIRGSTARGGCQALLEMIRNDDGATHLGITPDGPRGPRRELKPGAVMVASQLGVPIVPVGIGFVHAWRFRSWDHFALPFPGSTLVGVVGHPMHIPPELDRAGLKTAVAEVQEVLLDLTRQAERWAERIRREGAGAMPPVLAEAALSVGPAMTVTVPEPASVRQPA